MSSPLLRGIEILEHLAAQPGARTVAEVVNATGVPRSSAYRAIEELTAAGWVICEGSPARYRVSLRVAQLGLANLRQNHVRDVVLPAAIELARAVSRVCSIAFYEDGCVVHTDWIQVLAERVMPVLRGERAPALCTASGKILLTQRPESEIEEVIARGIPKLAANTKTDPAEIWADLRECKARGYGLSEGESRDDACGLSVPVFGAGGAAMGAIGILSDSATLTAEFIERVVPTAKAYAARASAELGFRVPLSGPSI